MSNTRKVEQLIALLRNCVSAMEMQVGRESGDLHISQPTAKHIWDEALEPARRAITDHEERANDHVIDLDAEAWASVKRAIEESPRFQEMFAAGGTFTDALANVRDWLREENPSYAADSPTP